MIVQSQSRFKTPRKHTQKTPMCTLILYLKAIRKRFIHHSHIKFTKMKTFNTLNIPFASFICIFSSGKFEAMKLAAAPVPQPQNSSSIQAPEMQAKICMNSNPGWCVYAQKYEKMNFLKKCLSYGSRIQTEICCEFC